MADARSVVELIGKEDVRTVDFRFTDLRGRFQHIGFAAASVDEAVLNDGIMFDGSAIAGWRDVSQSDMMLKPDLERAVLDPFSAQATLMLVCDVVEPASGLGYERCPRSVARRAEAHLVATQIADSSRVASQCEFFTFDDVRFGIAAHEAFWRVDAEEGPHNSSTRYDVGKTTRRLESIREL